MATTLPPATVKANTENGLPWGATRTPGAPLTRTRPRGRPRRRPRRPRAGYRGRRRAPSVRPRPACGRGWRPSSRPAASDRASRRSTRRDREHVVQDEGDTLPRAEDLEHAEHRQALPRRAWSTSTRSTSTHSSGRGKRPRARRQGNHPDAARGGEAVRLRRGPAHLPPGALTAAGAMTPASTAGAA
jgi:hypothetical protein